MNYAFVGRSNLSVSRICLGTMHFGSSAPKDEAFRIMDKALDLGINFFDTANVYGRSAGTGASEAIIGEWFETGGNRRDKVVLATKVYGDMVRDQVIPPNEEKGISAYKVRKHVADSLRRLKTDHIDLYQVHHIDRRISQEEYWETFERLVDGGQVLYLGTSNFPGWGLVKFQMTARQRGRLGIVSEQCQYNLLSRYPELEVIPAARDQGIGILPYMPVAGGLLTGKTAALSGSRTAEVEREYGISLKENAIFKEFSQLCHDLGAKEHIVAIAWVLSNPAVYSTILGIRSTEQLDGLEQAAELRLDQEILKRLETIFAVTRGRPLGSGPAPEAFAW